MPRPLKRRQALQNRAFLDALRRTGNVRLAARELGVHRSTFTKRRAKHPAFAAEWDAALAVAHARLNSEHPPGGHAQEKAPPATRRARPRADPAGEPRIIRLANGRLQLREPARGGRRIDRAARQAFLAALSATANVRLAARAAGFAHSSFYRLRDYDPAFAREMRMALELGYDRIELALLESFHPGSGREDAWRQNDPPKVPPMTASQALQLLYLRQKEVRFWQERPDRRRRRGEPREDWCRRLGRQWRAEKAREREGYEVARAAREDGEAPAHLEHGVPALPALEQVTGWSKARPADDETARKSRGSDRALFGGWRLEDWKRR